jgi:hypothetical protein
VAAWDWSRTWLAPPPGVLLTVSQDAKAGGKYRTLSEALADAKPWATIRVLDTETYAERLQLDEPDRHTGLVIEAPAGATLVSVGKASQIVLIKNVPHAGLRGFRLRPRSDVPAGAFPCVAVFGHAPGTVFADLDVSLPDGMDGIAVRGLHLAADEDPLLIRGCRIKGGARSVVLLGPLPPTKESRPLRGVVVDGNRLEGCLTGLVIQGRHSSVQVTSNRVWDCAFVGLQVQELGGTSADLLFANNTVFDCGSCFRVWHDVKAEAGAGQVTLAGNIFFNANRGADVSCFESTGTNMGLASNELAQSVARAWRFAGNWRDLSSTLTEGMVPLTSDDHKFDTPAFVSRQPDHADFMRPTADFFKLVQSKRVLTSPRLPPYAGAVPPAGVEPWDWQTSWQSWNRRPPPAAAKDASK